MSKEVLEYVGYFASIITAISMTMNSFVKFRWINLIGSIIFGTYGLLLNLLPVVGLNLFIISVDIYYLYKIYSKSEQFETLNVRPDNRYLLAFMKYHDEEIQKFVPGFTYKPELNTVSFFVLRNMAVAGVFLAHREENDVLKVGLDYVIPQYRDYKNGKYVYHRLKNYFIGEGFKKIEVSSKNTKYDQYLKKMGFSINESGIYETSLLK